MKKMKANYLIAVLLGLTLVASQATFADVTVVYKMTSQRNGNQTIKYRDKQHVRVDMNNGGKLKISMLKLGNKVYAITGKVVQDMSQLNALIATMGKRNKSSHKKHSPVKYKDTGKTETIAGIKGKVYRFVENGKQHEIVLGRNKNLQNAVLGVIEITKVGSSMMPDDGMKQMQHDASLKNMAILRLDNDVLLQSIKTSSISDSSFKLPSKPQQMGGIGSMMKGLLGQ